MKYSVNILLILFCILWGQQVFPQSAKTTDINALYISSTKKDNTTNNQTTGSKSINSLSSASSISHPTNKGGNNGETDKNPVKSVTKPDRTDNISLRKKVGAINANTTVNNTGSVSYNIPLVLPVGVNNLQPEVSISYNSQGGSGVLGIGWDVTATSVIIRGDKNIYYDSIKSPVSLSSDALYLDGQRLVLIEKNAWESNATYALEAENYSKIVYKGDFFELTTVDGKIYEYGKTSDSKITSATETGKTLGWKLNKITDPYGNTINYSYSDYGQYLTKIVYAGISIKFNYQSNIVNPKKLFIKDFCIEQAKLLKTIEVTTDTKIVRNYTFSYSSDNRLTTINNSDFGPTLINWGTDAELQCDYLGNATDPWLNNQTAGHASIQFADINGDGYNDRLEMWVGNSKSNGHIIAYIFDKENKTFANATTVKIEFPYHDPEKFHPQMIANDINNDGKSEIIFLNHNKLYAYTYDSKTNSFLAAFNNNEAAQSTDKIVQTYSTLNKVKLLAANVNNDKYNDIIIVYNYMGSESGSGVFYGTKNGLDISFKNNSSSLNAFQYFETGDFNADGQLDVFGSRTNSKVNPVDYDYGYIRFKSNFNYFKTASNELRFTADLNGDGLSDMLVFDKENSNWYAYKNNGNYNLSKVNVEFTNAGENNLLAALRNGYNQKSLLFADYNGDGLPDIISLFPVYGISDLNTYNQYSIYCYTNKGNFTFELEKSFGDFSGPITDLYTVSDINMDGLDDFVVAVNNDNETKASNYKYYVISMPVANKRNLVNDITNALDQKYNFTYTTFSNFYQGNETESLRNFKYPVTVIESITLPDKSTTNYAFEKPVIHTEGKGFLGFNTIIATNQAHNTTSVRRFDIDSTYFFPYFKSETITSADGKHNIKKLSSDASIKSIGKKRYAPLLSASRELDYLKNTITKNTSDFSNFPYSITEKREDKDSTTNQTDLKTTVTTTFTGPLNKTPYLPATVTTTRTLQNEQYVRTTTTDYIFDTTNSYKINKITTIQDPSDTNVLTTIYADPDNFGHLQKVTLTANGKTTSTQTQYDTSGRFIESYTNELNQTTIYNWNKDMDLLNSQCTVIGDKSFTTSYKYNSVGELQITTYPDGKTKTTQTKWNADNSALYYNYSQTSGEAPLWIFYDNIGREVKRETKGLNDKTVRMYTTYNNAGKVEKISNPTFNSYFDPLSDPCSAYFYNSVYGYIDSVANVNGTTRFVYDKLKQTIISPVGISVIKRNSCGQVINSNMNSESVDFVYYPSGLKKSSTPANGQSVTMEYNLQGNRTKITDPDGGVIESKYNGFGELEYEKQKIHNDTSEVVTSYTYDNSVPGLVKHINQNNKESVDFYYNSLFKNRIDSIEISGKHKKVFSYDNFNRAVAVKEYITENGKTKSFEFTKDYDSNGKIKKEKYPSGYYTENSYDSFGNLVKITDNTRTIWEAINANENGQLTELKKGNTTTNYTFDNRTLPTSISAKNIVDLTFEFNSKGNLDSQTDYSVTETEQTELYTYDELNRLTNWNLYINGNAAEENSLSYDNAGNIKNKSDVGENSLFNYNNDSKPHALATIDNITTNIPIANSEFTYTNFNKLETIHTGNSSYKIIYGVDNERKKSILYKNNHTKPTQETYYLGNYEEVTDSNGIVTKIHYLDNNAIFIETGDSAKFYYTYTDYKGSVLTLTDENGKIVERYAYDPWGKRKNPENKSMSDNRTSFITTRGFTGNEHLEEFGCINMNGRVYDPVTAQFFSADPYITYSYNWLNYNRYSYGLNNPFRYSDPSGNNPIAIAAALYTLFFTDLGYNVQKFVSPAAVHLNIGTGSDQRLIGYEVSLGVPKMIPLSYRYIYGETYSAKSFDNINNGKMTIEGGEWTFLGIFSYGGTTYKSGITSQTTNTATIGIPAFNLRYEDDHNALKDRDGLKWLSSLPWIPEGESDKFRTSAGQINIGLHSIGYNLLTGESDGTTHVGEDGYTYRGEKNVHRLGLVYIGYGPFKIGYNSERYVRSALQNDLIHKPLGLFLWDVLSDEYPDRFYWYIGSTGGSMW